MNLTKTTFFKSLMAFATAGMMAIPAFGQSVSRTELSSEIKLGAGETPTESIEAIHAEKMPATETTNAGNNDGKVAVDAQWDLQFAYAVSDTLGYFSGAGAFWTGTEFWTSKWNSDTLARLNPDGSLIEIFTIPGVTGTRSITSDGTNIYLGLANNNIAVVDPATKTLINTLTITGGAAGIGSRFLTYDPTLNGGNGGFYIGNFTSPIGIINKTGGTIGTVAQAVHGRVGMYGAAYDPISTGGPYLWVFEQSGNPTDAVISQLKLPACTWTGISFDVDTDLGLAGSLAGGLFVTTGIVTGQNTIGGLAQGDPNVLFGYELDFIPIQIDVQMTTAIPSPALSIVPSNQIPAYNFTGEVVNLGQNTVTSGSVDVEVFDAETNSVVYTGSSPFTNLANQGTSTYSIGPWTPADTGSYFVTVSNNSGAQTDENLDNDSAFYAIFVTDSTVARDQGPIATSIGLGFGPGTNGFVAQKLQLQTADFVTSLTMAFPSPSPNTNGVVFGTLYDPAPTGGPGALKATTTSYTFTQADSVNGLKVLTLPLAGGPVPFAPGSFYAGVAETGDFVGVAATLGIFEPGNLWVRADPFNGGNWASDPYTNDFVAIIRANLGPCTPTGLTGTVVIEDDDSGNNDATLTVNVNGGSGVYTYSWDDPNNSTGATLSGVAGGQAYTVTVTDSEGCTKSFTSDLVNLWATGVDELARGVVTFRTYPNPAKDEFFIDIELDHMQDMTMTLYDQTGRLVFAKEVGNVLAQVQSVIVRDYPAGVYTLTLTTDKGTVQRKIAVE